MASTETSQAESVPDPDTLDDVIRALSRLGTLNYQQRKILKDGDVLAVLEQFVAGQKSSDWMYLCAVVIFGGKAIFGFLFGQINWINATAGVFAGAAALAYWQQKKTVRAVTDIVRRYADAQGYQVPTTESQLMTALRLHHSLTYQQQQQMKAGEVVDVAKGVLKSSRRTGWIVLATMMPNALLQLDAPLRKQAPLTPTDMVAGFGGFVVATAFAIWMYRMHAARARRLEKLIEEHPAQIAALTLRVEVDSDSHSPYRAPEFQ